MSLAPAGLPALPAPDAARPGRPALAGPRPLRAVRAGTRSLTQYIQLYLSRLRPRARRPQGAAHLGLADARATRSTATPPGVEITTGPLGQGLANAVGMAMAARRERGLLDPDAAARREPVRPHHLGDRLRRRHRGGRHQRGQSSLAGHQELGNLVVVYDAQPHLDRGRHRRRAERGRRQAVRGVRLARAARRLDARPAARYDGGRRGAARRAASRREAETRRGRRSSSCARSSPGRRRTRRTPARRTARRSATTRSRATKRGPRLRPGQALRGRRRGARARPRGAGPRRDAARRRGRSASTPGASANPDRAELLDRLDRAPAARTAGPTRCPTFPAGKDVATRKASGAVLDALAPVLPELWGGSADLAGVQQHHDRGRAVVRPARARRPRCGRATRTAAPCTSASASTRWARSSTASRCTAAPARTAARSWCSATTCARRSGSRR